MIGDCIWAAVDYMGEVGVGKVYWENAHEDFNFMAPYPWRTSWQSDIDLTGEQRPQSVYREIMWEIRRSPVFTPRIRNTSERTSGEQTGIGMMSMTAGVLRMNGLEDR